MIVICKLLEMVPHENADRLKVTQCAIGESKTIQVVTNLVDLQVNQLLPVALIGHAMPEGSAIPRIKRAKLRGVESEGMFVSWDEVQQMNPQLKLEGDFQVGDVLVEDPIVEELNAPTGQFKKVSEIENAYQLDLNFFVDREVVIMEKMDGSSHRVGFRRGLKWCGGHNHMHAIGGKVSHDGFGFGAFVAENGIADRIAAYCEANQIADLGVYGEFCGPKIQKNPYGLDERHFYVFDMTIDEAWLDWDQVVQLAKEMQLELVRVDYLGMFDLETLDRLISNRSQFGDTHPREGVVLKLRQESVYPDGTRAILKHKPERRQERKSHRGKLELTPEMVAVQNLQNMVADYVTEERAEHVIGHLREAGQAIDFPSVVAEFRKDILKEADADHRHEFEADQKKFRKIVGQLVGQDHKCKRLIFAAMNETAD